MVEISSGTAALIKLGFDVLSRSSLANKKVDIGDNQSALDRHFRFLANWTSSIGLEGFVSDQKETDRMTVPLQARIGARRWRHQMNDVDNKNEIETDFLTQKRSIFLLGDPGGGKTTTVKRIIRSFLIPSAYDAKIEEYSNPNRLNPRIKVDCETSKKAAVSSAFLPL